MDDLILYGYFAVTALYLLIALVVAGAVYGVYLILVALLAGRYDLIVNASLLLGVLVLVYWGSGSILARLRII